MLNRTCEDHESEWLQAVTGNAAEAGHYLASSRGPHQALRAHASQAPSLGAHDLLQGNPWKYANFLNESLNKNLKNCCKHASQLTFESTVLWKATEAIPQALGRKRKYDFGS